jgi:hypothetical protein
LSKEISEKELEKIAKSIAKKIGTSDKKIKAIRKSGGLDFRCPLKFKCTKEYNCIAPHNCSGDAYTHKLHP